MLDLHAARNERDWQTKIARNYFPMPPAIKSDPALNQMLNLPHNRQLVGAVFILSRPSLRSDEAEDLVPAMDREGLLDNKAFEELKEYVRAGIEFLAKEDKEELDRLAEEEAKEAARAARQDIKSAIEHVQESPTLKPADKSRIIKQYQIFAERLEDVEEYSAQARRSLTTMSLLGVIAGFMTHESKAIAHELDGAVRHIRALGRKDTEIAKIADDLSRRLESFKGYLEYSRMFIKNVREPREQALSAAGQVRQVVNRFKSFTEDRGIKISNEIASDVMTPPLPVTLYSGVLLNLFTNAIKGVIAAKGSVTKPHVCFRAWNEKKTHVVEIADNGIGIPPEMRKRIWDPLYTTTSDVGNPLGSGMGLGLTLVKQVVGELGGSIALLPNPPAGFTTCFRVTLHRK
jgi:signal transduction histidine kinase